MMLGLSAGVWTAIGFLGQGLFTARFLVQWLASEKRKESVVPVAFWWLSLGGSAVLGLYSAARADPVFLLGSLVNGFLYARNLILIHVRNEKPTSRRVLVPTTLALCAFLAATIFFRFDRSIPMSWLVLGFLGAVCWSGRFVIQWYASERAGKSVMPRSFWYVGLVGALLLLTYSVLRKEPVFILGYLFPLFPYLRNLILIYRKEGFPAPVEWADAVWRTPRRRGAAIAIFAVLLGGFLAARVLHAKKPAGDFLRYHRAGRMVATGRADRLYDEKDRFFLTYAEDPAGPIAAHPEVVEYEKRFRYLPTFAVLMAPLGALPPKIAEILWAWHNAFCFLMTLAIARWFTKRHGVRAAWMWVPFLLTVRFGWDNMSLGQINPTIILCATAGAYLVETDRPIRGGLITALGAAVKFTPALLLLIFLIRGKWKAAAFTVLGIAFFVLVLPGAVLGPGRSGRLLDTVWTQQGEKLMVEGESFDVPGESFRSMTYRILGTMPLRKQGHVVDISFGLITSSQALVAYRLLSGALLLWLIWFAVRRRGGIYGPLVYGATLSAGLLISPETRQPHFQVLILAVTAAVMVMVRSGRAPWRSRTIFVLVSLAFVLTALPSRGIVGTEATLYFAAWCAGGFAAIFLIASDAFAATLLAREPEEGS